jgi:hypothetical protein
LKRARWDHRHIGSRPGKEAIAGREIDYDRDSPGAAMKTSTDRILATQAA